MIYHMIINTMFIHKLYSSIWNVACQTIIDSETHDSYLQCETDVGGSASFASRAARAETGTQVDC
jgi:hypothetical protein